MSDEPELQSLRPSARPFVTAIVLNLLVAVALLGWPYLRGRERARESARAVVELTACLLDGTPREGIGFALPPGERERFATLFEHAPEDWPGRCRPVLDRARHEPATFILPSPKAAELDLAEALDAMATALLDLEQARVHRRGSIPDAPLEALGRVRGFAASLLVANDVDVDPEVIGVDLGERADTLPAPSRIPVRTGAGFFYAASSRAPLLRLVTSDGLGIAEVETFAAEGESPARVRLLQLRRPRSARGVVVGREDAWLVWTTSEATCETDAQRCAMRATGLGRLVEGGRVMRPEHWLAAHPAGPIERSIAIGDAHVTVMARAPEGAIEARLVPRGDPIPAPPASARSSDEPPAPPPPTLAIAVRAFVDGIDWAVEDARVRLLRRAESGPALTLARLGTEPAEDVVVPVLADASQLEVCDDATVVLSVREGQVVRGGVAWPAFVHGARTPMRGPSYAASSIHVACDEEVVVIGALAADGSLHVHRCGPGGCESFEWGGSDVESFDLTIEGSRTWIASSGGERDPAIRVGVVGGPTPWVAAACWAGGRGMCGPARWALGHDGPRILTARDGSDVLALELVGDALAPLPGLQ